MTSFKEQYGPWCVIAGGSDGIGAAFASEGAVMMSAMAPAERATLAAQRAADFAKNDKFYAVIKRIGND